MAAATGPLRFPSCSKEFCGDPSGTRTHNPLIKSQLLCRLSYRVATLALPHAENAISGTTSHALKPTDSADPDDPLIANSAEIIANPFPGGETGAECRENRVRTSIRAEKIPRKLVACRRSVRLLWSEIRRDGASKGGSTPWHRSAGELIPAVVREFRASGQQPPADHRRVHGWCPCLRYWRL